MPDIEEEAICSRWPQDDAPGLEGLLRTDMGALHASLPSLLDRAIRRPVILTRGGSDAFVFPALDACSRPRARAPRLSAVDAHRKPGG